MKKLVLIVTVITLLVGCKKYPDGPSISFLSRDTRIIGEWDVEYFSIDGYDSTNYLKNSPFYGKYFFSNEDSHGKKAFFYNNSYTSIPNYNGDGYWMFLNSKGSVYIHYSYLTNGPSVGPYRVNDITWEIRRLKSKELWLKSIYNGKEYFIKFKHP